MFLVPFVCLMAFTTEKTEKKNTYFTLIVQPHSKSASKVEKDKNCHTKKEEERKKCRLDKSDFVWCQNAKMLSPVEAIKALQLI